jgi:hypothetical protein
MTKKQMAELEVWARARFESIAPELASFGLIDIAFNDQRMAEQLLREPSSRRLPINGDVHFGVRTGYRRPTAARRRRARFHSPRPIRRYPESA